jgi:hypothetical protein
MEELRFQGGECGGYWYGKTFIYIGDFFRITPDMRWYIAIALLTPAAYLLVVLGSSAYIRQDLIGRVLVVANLLSPPVLLLFQRGNLDLLMLLMLIVGSSLMGARSQKKAIAGWLLLLLATLIKFWSLPALFVGLLWIKGRLPKVLAFIVSIIVTFKVVEDYRSVDFPESAQTIENLFGFKYLSLALNSTSSYSLSTRTSLMFDAAGLVFTAACVALLLNRLSKFGLLRDVKGNFEIDQRLWILGSCFVFCYFSSSNVDYRLVLLLLLLLDFLSRKQNLQMSNLLLIMLSTTMWLTYPSGKLQLIGDFMAGMFSILLIIFFVMQTKATLKSKFSLR